MKLPGKMWFDEINKKIEDAEANNSPAFNDKAWKDMEWLLDKHLPLKKKRRRFIFFLLFPLVLGGAATFFFIQQDSKTSGLITGSKKVPVSISASPDDSGNSSHSSQEPLSVTNGKPIVLEDEPAQTGPVSATAKNSSTDTNMQDNATAPFRSFRLNKKINADHGERQNQSRPFYPGKKIVKNGIKPGENIVTESSLESNNQTQFKNAIPDKINPVAGDSASVQNPIAGKDDKLPDTALSHTEPKAATTTQKSKTSAAGKLSLNLSFGPDVSSVGIDKPGTPEMQYGVGISYALSQRLSIRAGFYAATKKYTADSADYHLRYSINNLQKIHADCFVYEIPLTVVYNFGASKKHNWFVSGGLSSYLMKKETYEYYYKNSWGQPQSYSHTYKNENTHIFSVINLSGGYQYHFTDRLSVMAEPYIKIPASGIGMGKVKLNSTGILFSIGFKPFLKEK